MDKLDQVALSNGQDSAKTFIDRLDHDPKQQARFEADVQQIIKTAGGCDTDALRERQAEGRQLIDTYTQALAAPGGTLVVNWPMPALQEPIHVSVVRRGHDAQGREYLKLLLRNPSKEPVGVALAGKELRAGLCFDLKSAELPITQQSYRAIQFAHLAPGDSLSANLTFSADCFDDLDETALMGTLILETSTGTEYRAIAVLGIRD